MNRVPIKSLLALAALHLTSSPARAQNSAAAPQGQAESQSKGRPKASVPSSQAKVELNPLIAAQSKARSKALKAQKAKAAPVEPPVDLNGATKEALKQLPGVTDRYADKIIAGRPYLTKVHLVTHDVLPYGLYESIKHRIVAQPPKLGGK